MKTKLLLTLAEIMLRVPEYAHDQRFWQTVNLKKKNCGTTLCAGGWAAFYGLDGLMLVNGEVYLPSANRPAPHGDYSFYALAKAFDINYNDACWLFSSAPATPLEMHDRITGFVSYHSSIAIVKDWNSMRSMG